MTLDGGRQVDDVRIDRDLAGINRVVAIKRHLAL